MQETRYEDGSKVVRVGPLSEMQAAAMEDLMKEGVASVQITKLPDTITPEMLRAAIEGIEEGVKR